MRWPLQLFLEVLDKGTATGTTGTRDAANPASTNRGKAVLPDLLLCCICWVLGEYGTLADKLPSPHKITTGQVNACAVVRACGTGSCH